MLERRPILTALACAAVSLACFCAIWLPLLPNAQGRVDVDYSLWLPDLLAGYFWYLRNGVWQLPWFSPAQCAGIPFHADPQVAFLSLPQFLTFVMPPLAAVKLSILAFAGAGFAGAWWLGRARFGLRAAQAGLLAGLFVLNRFYGARMAAGHLTYAPFMLLPALAACALPRPGGGRAAWAEEALRAGGIAAMLGLAIQAGMVHALPPLGLSLLAVLLMHGLWLGWSWRPIWRLAAGGVVALALCAGKLAASLALLSHFPRTLYPLPGIADAGTLLATVLRCLFLTVDDSMGHLIANTAIAQEQHEFEYSVSPVPGLLMLAALAVPGVRAGLVARLRAAPWLGVGLVACLVVPVVLNFYAPGWNHFLKSLPFFGNSSTNLRWMAALMLPAILGGALAWARTPLLARHELLVLVAGLALAGGCAALGDRAKYGPQGMGIYDAQDIELGWQAAHRTGEVPGIAAVGALLDENNRPVLAPERQNAFVHGFSQLFCYEPLFGYRLEKFPMQGLRGGDVLEPHDGKLNFKNPACYVFPEANACQVGDVFSEADTARVSSFLAYGPLSFEKPLYARLADWLSLGVLAGLLLGLPGAGIAYYRRVRS